MPFGRGRMSSVVDDEIKNKELSKLEAIETQEWLDSLDHILQQGGPGRVRRLLRQLQIHAQEAGVKLPFTANTPYINTIPAEEQPPFPGSRTAAQRLFSFELFGFGRTSQPFGGRHWGAYFDLCLGRDIV